MGDGAPAQDEHVSFPRRDTGSGSRVKKVRFCEAEPMQIPFSPARKRIYENGEKMIPCNEFPAVAHMFCDERQQITIEANKKASKHVRFCDLEPRRIPSPSLQLMKLFGKAGIPDTQASPSRHQHADMLKETRKAIWAKRASFNEKRAPEQSRTHFDPLEDVATARATARRQKALYVTHTVRPKRFGEVEDSQIPFPQFSRPNWI